MRGAHISLTVIDKGTVIQFLLTSKQVLKNV